MLYLENTFILYAHMRLERTSSKNISIWEIMVDDGYNSKFRWFVSMIFVSQKLCEEYIWTCFCYYSSLVRCIEEDSLEILWWKNVFNKNERTSSQKFSPQ